MALCGNGEASHGQIGIIGDDDFLGLVEDYPLATNDLHAEEEKNVIEESYRCNSQVSLLDGELSGESVDVTEDGVASALNLHDALDVLDRRLGRDEAVRCSILIFHRCLDECRSRSFG